VRLIVIAILLAALPASADDATEGSASLEEVTARLAAPAVLRGNFAQSRKIASLHVVAKSSGRFILSDKGLYWQQNKPMAAIMIADGKRLQQQIGDGPMQTSDTAMNPVMLSFSNSFLSIFTGSEADLRSNFDVAFTDGSESWTIHLTPSTYPMSEAISSIILRGHEYIETITVISRSSDESTISFTDLQTEPDQLTDNELELYAR